MPDVITRLRDADPIADPPDPCEPAARVVLERSLTRPSVAPAPHRAPVARRVLAGGAVALTGAAAVLAVSAGGDVSTDARAAIVRAVDALGEPGSGTVVVDQRNTSDADGRDLGSSHQVIRFSGEDVETSGYGTLLTPDGVRTEPLADVRRVDGRVFLRDADGWRVPATDRLPGLVPEDAGGPATRAAAQALAGALRDVEAADDGRTFRGTVSADALPDAYGAVDPVSVRRITGAAPGPIAVRLQLGDDGALARVTFTTRGPWSRPALPSATSRLTLDYSQVGSPQSIPVPPLGGR